MSAVSGDSILGIIFDPDLIAGNATQLFFTGLVIYGLIAAAVTSEMDKERLVKPWAHVTGLVVTLVLVSILSTTHAFLTGNSAFLVPNQPVLYKLILVAAVSFVVSALNLWGHHALADAKPH